MPEKVQTFPVVARPAPSVLADAREKARGGFQTGVVSAAERIVGDLALADAGPRRNGLSAAVAAEIHDQVTSALETAVSPTDPSRIRRWYSGNAHDAARASLHRAGQLLFLLLPDAAVLGALPGLDASVKAQLPAGDPRQVAHLATIQTAESAATVTPTAPVPDSVRHGLVAAQRDVDLAWATAHASVRKWRNLLCVAGAAVFLISVAVSVVHAFSPSFVSLAVRGSQTDAVEPWAVALIGSLGGAVAAVLALNRFSGFTDPSGLPTAQALLRIPMAATTSLVGVLLMQTSALGALKPQTGTSLLAFAFIFGYAQEPLLRMIDKQAGRVLDPARTANDPVRRENLQSPGTRQETGQSGGRKG
jgi:hypothetical protein